MTYLAEWVVWIINYDHFCFAVELIRQLQRIKFPVSAGNDAALLVLHRQSLSYVIKTRRCHSQTVVYTHPLSSCVTLHLLDPNSSCIVQKIWWPCLKSLFNYYPGKRQTDRQREGDSDRERQRAVRMSLPLNPCSSLSPSTHKSRQKLSSCIRSTLWLSLTKWLHWRWMSAQENCGDENKTSLVIQMHRHTLSPF